MASSRSRIGWLLVWGVAFCDIGTSVYYVPGILYGTNGDLAGLFTAITMVAFVFLCIKYVEITRRFRDGGGVVRVADAAFGPFWGCLGGQFIMVDYFLTAAISATSGAYYVDSLFPLHAWVIPSTLIALVALGGLNIIGIRESAGVSFVLAIAALVVDVVVIGTALLRMPADVLREIPAQLAQVRHLRPLPALIGYSAAWLAFSGLESVSQLSPAMRDFEGTPRKGMLAVAISVILTSPLLTFLSIATLPEELKLHESERFISELGAVWGGYGLKAAVVMTASVLLLFAANTAIIGNYHVQLALVNTKFMPDGFARLSRRFHTPYRAILFSVAVPAALVVFSGGNMHLLGDLYAFGLLGAFVLSSTGIDWIHVREKRFGPWFVVGIVTSLLVIVAWGVNLVYKPHATIFGGAVTTIGMFIAYGTRRGWWEKLAAKIPRLAEPEHEEGIIPSRTIRDVLALPDRPRYSVLVASRGADERVYKEAAARAKAKSEDGLWLIYVDEVPGLFYPPEVAPTPEGLTVLQAGVLILKTFGIHAEPIWALAHTAGERVGEAAVALGAETVVIGATRRGILWKVLRGRFLEDLIKHVPSNVRVAVVD
jgi:amino acid transporter